VAGESFRWNTAATALEAVALSSGGSNIVPTFVQLVDAPDALVAGSYIVVTALEDGVEFSTLGPGSQVLLVHDEKTQGTDGGSTSTGSWQTHDLNLVELNTISGASLATNQLTLPAGDYIASCHMAFFRTGEHIQCRIRDVDTPATLLLSVDISTDNSTGIGGSQEQCPMVGSFTLSQARTVEFQYQVSVANAGDGLGQSGTDTSEARRFATMLIRKVDLQ